MPSDAMGRQPRGKKQTSQDISTIAGRILRMKLEIKSTHVSARAYNELLLLAKKLAGSALSQDEVAG